ncbi:MAG TPA: hypothetical protein VLR49_10055, partial [Ferruginibacter sp.]|nr:hypothetical protein [Ferruginibacter sp.]
MEVHRHSHTSHGKKNWKNYFWEFIMLFLAVTLGFFVENQREHYIEYKRSEVLAKSMLEDLKKDTASIATGIEQSIIKSGNSQELIDLMLTPINKWDTLLFLTKFSSIIGNANKLLSIKSTYEQLKASGSLRYFEQSLINQINTYYNLVSKSEERDDIENKFQLENATPLILNNINMVGFTEAASGRPLSQKQNINFADKNDIQKFINMIIIGKIVREVSADRYNEQLNGAL